MSDSVSTKPNFYRTAQMQAQIEKLQSELDKAKADINELTQELNNTINLKNENTLEFCTQIQDLEAQVAELKNTLQHMFGKTPCPSKVDTKGEAIQILQDVINKTLKQCGSLHKPIYFIWLREALSKVDALLGKEE